MPAALPFHPRRSGPALVTASLLVTVACGTSASSSARAESQAPETAAVATAAVSGDVASSDTNRLVVYKSPTCGCCRSWVDHAREAGFTVEVHDLANVDSVKNVHGVPSDLRSCHTARVAGYTIEGHVPASDIRRFLRERPAVAGIAVPGMPMGSPGMEGAYKDRYDVLTFGGSAAPVVFASH